MDIQTILGIFGSKPVVPKESSVVHEAGVEHFKQIGTLFAPKNVGIVLQLGCTAKTLALGQQGDVTVVLFGAADLYVSQVELSRLLLHGAAPRQLDIRAVNGDQKPDLIAVFDMAQIKLNPNAVKAELTGWLKNGQRFFGKQAVNVVPRFTSIQNGCGK